MYLSLGQALDHGPELRARHFAPAKSAIYAVDHAFGLAHFALLLVVAEFPYEPDADAPSLFSRGFNLFLGPPTEIFASHFAAV